MPRIAVYAIGGNALSNPTSTNKEDAAFVLANVMSDVVDLLEAGWQVVLTHGNGPQVGHLLTLDGEYTNGMDEWVAATQGMIGHSLAMHLDSILHNRRRPERTAVVITRVEVDSGDKGFKTPTKPVGPILTDEVVMSADWDIGETVHGPRRLVASPLPMRILDIDVIEKLVELRAVVICGGGGGIPVIQDQSGYHGVPAVVDKDRLSALLAIKLRAAALIISTGIDSVKTGFGTTSEKSYASLSIDQCEQFLDAGEFPAGSMAPKIGALMEAALHNPSCKAILCKPGDASKALRGDAGTLIKP